MGKYEIYLSNKLCELDIITDFVPCSFFAVRVLPKGNVKAHLADWLKSLPALKNSNNLNQIIQRARTSEIIPTMQKQSPNLEEMEDPNIIKAHVPDLIRSYKSLPNGLKDVLENNREWANAKSLHKIKFFETLDKGQEPKLFWIGKLFAS
jgi:hypothetical protein